MFDVEVVDGMSDNPEVSRLMMLVEVKTEIHISLYLLSELDGFWCCEYFFRRT